MHILYVFSFLFFMQVNMTCAICIDIIDFETELPVKASIMVYNEKGNLIDSTESNSLKIKDNLLSHSIKIIVKAPGYLYLERIYNISNIKGCINLKMHKKPEVIGCVTLPSFAYEFNSIKLDSTTFSELVNFSKALNNIKDQGLTLEIYGSHDKDEPAIFANQRAEEVRSIISQHTDFPVRIIEDRLRKYRKFDTEEDRILNRTVNLDIVQQK